MSSVDRFELDPGTYVVIPCCYDFDEEADFMLRIFSESDCGQPEPDSETMRIPGEILRVRLCSYKAIAENHSPILRP